MFFRYQYDTRLFSIKKGVVNMYDFYLSQKEKAAYKRLLTKMRADEKALELTPADGHKSFYGKALVIRENDCIYLQSYQTIVLSYNLTNGTFIKLWDSYSATTQRHINSFLVLGGFTPINKKQWLKLPYNQKFTL